MMRWFSFPFLFLFIPSIVQAQIVLNELYYDHPGLDSGYEFVELFNPAPVTASLAGYALEFHDGRVRLSPWVEAGFEDPRSRYAGRSTTASPAAGLLDRHRQEQAQLVDEALTVGLPRVGRLAAAKQERPAGAED